MPANTSTNGTHHPEAKRRSPKHPNRLAAFPPPEAPRLLVSGADLENLRASGLILHAAMSDTFSKVWKLWVSSESIAALCLVGRSSRQCWMAAWNLS